MLVELSYDNLCDHLQHPVIRVIAKQCITLLFVLGVQELNDCSANLSLIDVNLLTGCRTLTLNA